MNPVYSIFGYKMRLRWNRAHHLYWGILGMLISAYGFYSAVGMALYGYYHQFPLDLILGLLIAFIQVLAFSVWTYVAWDDVDQHHMQVLLYDPMYHSPVHIWFSEVLWKYRIVRWITNRVDWLLGKL